MNWIRTDDWIGSEVEDSFILLNLETGQYVALNRTAAAVWSRLAEPSSLDQVVDGLLSRFDVERGVCERSVSRLMDDFVERGLARQAV